MFESVVSQTLLTVVPLTLNAFAVLTKFPCCRVPSLQTNNSIAKQLFLSLRVNSLLLALVSDMFAFTLWANLLAIAPTGADKYVAKL